MATHKTRRWLAVASRAASFRTLLQSADVARSKRVMEASRGALADGQQQTSLAQAAWREHAKAASFHVGSDAHYRRFHGHLVHAEARLASTATEAEASLTRAEDGLRLELARRDGLKKSLERTTRRLRDERQRLALKEADETWNVLRTGRVNDEDS